MEQNSGLIRTRRGAIIALCLSSYIAAQSIQEIFSHSQSQFHWLILDRPLDFGLPIWVVAVVNLAFYAVVIFGAVSIYRNSSGKQRILVAGWAIGLLGPIGYLSTSADTVIRYAEVAGMTAAAFAAVHLVLEKPPAVSKHDSRAPTTKVMTAALFGAALVLGLLAALIDSGSRWNDDGLTLGMLALGASLLGVLGPRKPWLWALGAYACAPIFYLVSPPPNPWSSPTPLPFGLNNRVGETILATVAYLIFPLAGAYLGLLIRGLLDRSVRTAGRPPGN